MMRWFQPQPSKARPLKLFYGAALLGLILSAPVGWALPAQKPVQLSTESQALDLTDDVSVAEAQVRAYPEDPEAAFLLAVAYSRTPQLEKALHALKRAKSLLKKNPQGYQLLEGKIQEYEGMLKYRPDDPRVLYRLAFGYYMKAYALRHYVKTETDDSAEGYLDKSESAFRKVIQISPQDVWSRNYYGYLLAERQDSNLDRAVGIWEESLVVNPDNPGAYLLLGEAYLKKGDMKKAVEYAAKGLQARAVLGL